MLKIDNLIDDAKCYETVRQMRWPDGVRCVWCNSSTVTKRGRDDRQHDRQRYHCRTCQRDFDDLSHTIFAGHHQPLRKWILALYLMGLNLSNAQIAQELALHKDDVHQMTSQWREGIVERKPTLELSGTVECDEVYIVALAYRSSGSGEKKGRQGRRRRLKGARGRGTLAKEKPPVLGMIQRGGEVVIRMLPDVKQVTIEPVMKATIAPGTAVMTDEDDIYARLTSWGYGHQTVCHARGEYARDEDGDGFGEVHVNTIEGFWSLLRSWLRPHRGVSQEKLPLSLGFFEFVHNVRKRGQALLGSLLALLLT